MTARCILVLLPPGAIVIRHVRLLVSYFVSQLVSIGWFVIVF